MAKALIKGDTSRWGVIKEGIKTKAQESGRRSSAPTISIECRPAGYTVPTDQPEADGTLAWDSTTLVLVEVRAGGRDRHRLDLRPPPPPRDSSSDVLAPVVLEPATPSRRPTLGSHGARRAQRRPSRPGEHGGLRGRHRPVGPGSPAAGHPPHHAGSVPAHDRCPSTAVAASPPTTTTARPSSRQWIARRVDPREDQDRRGTCTASSSPATCSVTTSRLMVDANGAYRRRPGTPHRAAARRARRHVVRGACHLRRPRRSRPSVRDHLAPTSPPASTATTSPTSTAWRRRRRLRPGRRDPVRRLHRVATHRRPRRRARAGGLGALRALPAHPVAAATPSLRHLEWFHDHVRIVRQVVDGFVAPVDGMLPPLERTGHGLRLRHDASPAPEA